MYIVCFYIYKESKEESTTTKHFHRPSSTKEKTHTKKGLGKFYDSQVSSDHFMYNFGPKVTSII